MSCPVICTLQLLISPTFFFQKDLGSLILKKKMRDEAEIEARREEIRKLADEAGGLLALGKQHGIVERHHEDDGRRLRRELAQPRTLLSTSQASPPRGSGTYTISFQFLSSLTPAEQASFEYAAERLGKIITTTLPPVATPSNANCGAVPSQTLPSTLGDLLIYVQIEPIDGVGGVLGEAGPCLLDRNGYPRVGYVQFDSADVQQMIQAQTFDAVCVHEYVT